MSDTSTLNEADDISAYQDGGRKYRAFTIARRCQHLMFVPEHGKYDRLLPLADIRLVEARKDGTELLIEFSDRTVIVTGQRLRYGAAAIGAGQCSRVESYNPEHHDKPGQNDPLVSSIAYYTHKKADVLAAKPDAGKPETH